MQSVASASLPKVIIVGGGIGGLTAALALLKRGIDVEVYEQSAMLKEVGAGVQLGSNGTRVLDALGLRDALDRFRSFLPRARYVTGAPAKPGTGSISARRRPNAMAHRTSCCIAATSSAFWPRRCSS